MTQINRNLTEEEKDVLFKGGTEAPFSGEFVHTKDAGMYVCKNCGNELFSSDTKFDSGTGWPSFTDPSNTQHIILEEDDTHGMRRTEVKCANCQAHLGHVFDDGPGENGKRYCINSVCLDLKEK